MEPPCSYGGYKISTNKKFLVFVSIPRIAKFVSFSSFEPTIQFSTGVWKYRRIPFKHWAQVLKLPFIHSVVAFELWELYWRRIFDLNISININWDISLTNKFYTRINNYFFHNHCQGVGKDLWSCIIWWRRMIEGQWCEKFLLLSYNTNHAWLRRLLRYLLD